MPISTIELRKEVAARLKRAREKAGYDSAESFCEKNKLSLDQYALYEKGKLPIKTSQAMKYCKLLRISLQWLLIGDE
jgi:hypothetical protein